MAADNQNQRPSPDQIEIREGWVKIEKGRVTVQSETDMDIALPTIPPAPGRWRRDSDQPVAPTNAASTGTSGSTSDRSSSPTVEGRR